MLSTGDTTIVIPKGNMAYDKFGNIYELTEDTPIKLGTDWGNATFRKWFENQVIPDLKAGRISPGVLFGGVSGNKFIKDLKNPYENAFPFTYFLHIFLPHLFRFQNLFLV